MINFAEKNDIDIDLEPPKVYRGYMKFDNGSKVLVKDVCTCDKCKGV